MSDSLEVAKQRFEDKYITIPETGCWWWIGMQNRPHKGYGLFCFEGRKVQAHRFSYQLYIGDIPDGLHVLHRCDNSKCVNPNHLFLGTHIDNMSDMLAKGRRASTKGSKNGRSKIDERIAAEIKASNLPGTVLAEKYGVTRVAISQMRLGKTWKHVSPARTPNEGEQHEQS